jgi:penicillin-binding protein 2
MYWDAKSQFGNEPIQTTAAQYGYGQPTGIDIPNESLGRVDSQPVRQKLHAGNPTAFPNDTWYTGDNMELAFGQGGTVITPLQQAVAYATFANGGTRYAPEVAAGVVSPDGKVVSTVTPKVTGHVALTPANYQAMLAGFEGVITTGTGSQVFSGWNQAAFTLGGKTGTASVNGQEPTSWFVGFGPNPNPQYVGVSEINEGGYGAQASAPVVRKIFDYLAAHPVASVALPPPTAAINATGPAALPSTTTTTAPGSTTTTTAPGSTTPSTDPASTTPSTDPGSTTTTAPGTATGTGAAYRATTPTTKARQAKGSGHSP